MNNGFSVYGNMTLIYKQNNMYISSQQQVITISKALISDYNVVKQKIK